MVTPLGAPTLAEAVAQVAEVYAAAGRQITRQRVQTVLGQLHTATAGMPRRRPYSEHWPCSTGGRRPSRPSTPRAACTRPG